MRRRLPPRPVILRPPPPVFLLPPLPVLRERVGVRARVVVAQLLIRKRPSRCPLPACRERVPNCSIPCGSARPPETAPPTFSASANLASPHSSPSRSSSL